MEGSHHSHHLTKITHKTDEAKPSSIEADKRRGEREDKPKQVLQPRDQALEKRFGHTPGAMEQETRHPAHAVGNPSSLLPCPAVTGITEDAG